MTIKNVGDVFYLLKPGVILASEWHEVLVIVREWHRFNAVAMKHQLGVHRTRLKVPDYDFSLHSLTQNTDPQVGLFIDTRLKIHKK